MNNEEQLFIPEHIGIIMDGNRRWAKEKGLPTKLGHKQGAENLRELVLYANELGLKYLSVYAFSTENFKREKSEVDYLMNLFITKFKKEFGNLKDIKIVFSGKREPLSDEVWDAMEKITEKTKDNKGLVLNVCLNYGGHSELVDMTKKICKKYKDGDIKLEDIDEEYLRKNMYQDLPYLDLVIRTSGELRISNFMLYQASYAEFYFPKVYFPDFNKEEFKKAIIEYNKRTRRFGGNS